VTQPGGHLLEGRAVDGEDRRLGRTTALPAGHYRMLAELSGRAEPNTTGIDRRQFDLGAMDKGYFRALTFTPVYLNDLAECLAEVLGSCGPQTWRRF